MLVIHNQNIFISMPLWLCRFDTHWYSKWHSRSIGKLIKTWSVYHDVPFIWCKLNSFAKMDIHYLYIDWTSPRVSFDIVSYWKWFRDHHIRAHCTNNLWEFAVCFLLNLCLIESVSRSSLADQYNLEISRSHDSIHFSRDFYRRMIVINHEVMYKYSGIIPC